MSIAFSVRGKGADGVVARAATIVRRFGTTPEPMARALSRYLDLTESFGVRPTFPVTARVLEREQELFRHLASRNVEFAVHGLVHNDHARLSFDRQRESIARAVEIFHDSGIRCTGFRGPYLRYNELTHQAVRCAGLHYHSSQAVIYPIIPPELCRGLAAERYRLALDLYSALQSDQVAVRPHEVNGLVEIPVALPDDEILIDRLHANQKQLESVWSTLFELTYGRGELFTVQLHPERFSEFFCGLGMLLDEARRRSPAVWVASLDEIACWWGERKSAVIDVTQLDDRCYHLRLSGTPDVTFLAHRFPEIPSTPWYGNDAICAFRELSVESPRKPVVGVSRDTHTSVVHFLQEEGYPVERSDSPDKFGAWIDANSNSITEPQILTAIDAGPGPLLRVSRWPRGARSALAVTGDIDSMTVQDFVRRLWEAR